MAEWIAGWIEQGGYVGLAALMFLENVFPPIPSEVVLPLAGAIAARGELSIVGVIVSGAIGALAGAFFWYGVGRAIPAAKMRAFLCRHGRWLAMNGRDLDRARNWFERYGGGAVFLGRLAPTVRTLISAPAGVLRMPLGTFSLFTAVGTTLWTTFLALAGYGLGAASEQVQSWIDPIANAVLAVGLVVYVWRVVTFRPDADDPDCDVAAGRR